MEHGLQISLKRYALSMEDRWLEVLSAPGVTGETVPAGQGRCYEKNQGKNNMSLFAKFAKENVLGQSSL